MGNKVSSQSSMLEDKDWEYVAAIRDPEVLDWKKGLSDQEIYEVMERQSRIFVQPLLIDMDENILLGSAKSVECANRLVDLGITHVLNMAGPIAAGPTAEYQKSRIEYLEIDSEDEEGYPLLEKHFMQCHEFIQMAREQKGRCVVHCMAGMNRSVAIIIAELLHSKGLTEKASVVEIVRNMRRIRGNWALSNESFQEQLVAFAKQKGRLGHIPCDTFKGLPPSTRRPHAKCALDQLTS